MTDILIPQGLTYCSKSLFAPDEHVLLKYTDGTSDKFWAAIPDNGSYIITWGRNGRKPSQSQVVAKWEAQRRLDEKLNKGYDYCSQNELLQYCLTDPKWFTKVDGSAEFNSAIRAQILNLELSKEPKQKRTKLKI